MRAMAQAAVGTTAASASVYAVAVHWIVSSEAPKDCESRRSATLTIVMSSTAITLPTTVTARVRFRAVDGTGAGRAGVTAGAVAGISPTSPAVPGLSPRTGARPARS